MAVSVNNRSKWKKNLNNIHGLLYFSVFFVDFEYELLTRNSSSMIRLR